MTTVLFLVPPAAGGMAEHVLSLLTGLDARRNRVILGCSARGTLLGRLWFLMALWARLARLLWLLLGLLLQVTGRALEQVLAWIKILDRLLVLSYLTLIVTLWLVTRRESLRRLCACLSGF